HWIEWSGKRGPTDRTDAAPPASLLAGAPRRLALQGARLVPPPTLLAVAAARIPGLAHGDGIPQRGRPPDARGVRSVLALDGENAIRQTPGVEGTVKRLFLVLVVAGGAALTVPDLRARARPHLEPAFGDVMDWWADRLQPVVDPALRWSAT